jgi:hypothetical protein
MVRLPSLNRRNRWTTVMFKILLTVHGPSVQLDQQWVMWHLVQLFHLIGEQGIEKFC